MKQLGSHPNVVSLVGCCTLQDEKFLVIEYVPFGDLLTWLRCTRNRVRKWRNFYIVLWTRVTEEKKVKDSPLEKREGTFPVFPFFECEILSIFALFPPYFSRFSPYYNTRLPPFPLPLSVPRLPPILLGSHDTCRPQFLAPSSHFRTLRS